MVECSLKADTSDDEASDDDKPKPAKKKTKVGRVLIPSDLFAKPDTNDNDEASDDGKPKPAKKKKKTKVGRVLIPSDLFAKPDTNDDDEASDDDKPKVIDRFACGFDAFFPTFISYSRNLTEPTRLL